MRWRLVELRMPLRFLRSTLPRLVLTLVALACAVALVCAIDLANQEVMRTFTEVVDGMAGRAALQVSAGEGGSFPEAVADAVAAVDGVELAAPVVGGTAFTTDDSGTLLTVQGVDVTNDAAVHIYETRGDAAEIDDPLVMLSQPDSIVLTRAFAARRGLAIGDRLPLLTPQGERAFTVRGLLEPHGVARVYGGDLAVMDVYAAEAVFTRPGFINRVDVVVRGDADRGRVEAAVRAVLPEGLRVETPEQRKADLHAVVRSLQVMLRAIALVVLVAAFLIAFNRLTTVFEERAWQAGLLRAVGVRQRAVGRTFAAEALLVGVGGIALGLPMGWGLGHLLLPTIAATTGIATDLLAKPGTLQLHPGTLALAGGLGLGAALLAAALPARRGARHTLSATVRGRGVEQPPASGRVMTAARGMVLAALAVTLLGQGATRSATFGLAATVLIVVTAALAARPLLELARPILPTVLAAIVGPAGRFAAASLTRHARRTGLTIATLGVGVGAVVWVWTIAISFERSLLNALTPAFRSDLIVASAHQGSGLYESPLDDGIADRLAELPGVAGVASSRTQAWRYHGTPIVVQAMDPQYFRDERFGRWVLVGRHAPDAWEQVARGEGVTVSTNFVTHFGLGLGDRLVLDTPAGRLVLPIVAVSLDFASPGGTIKMSRALYARMWNDRQVTLVMLRVASGTTPDEMRAEIARRLGRTYGLKILSSGEMLAHFVDQARQGFRIVHVLGGLVLLVVLIGMADTLAAGVMEQTRELGAMRALGVRRRQLGRMVVAQSLALAVFGLLLAIVAGLALGMLWVLATFPNLLGWTLELHVPYAQLGVAAAVTLAVCLMAALSPARRIARFEPTSALRYE
jgi:putative ABC transport system permease protein